VNDRVLDEVPEQRRQDRRISSKAEVRRRDRPLDRRVVVDRGNVRFDVGDDGRDGEARRLSVPFPKAFERARLLGDGEQPIARGVDLPRCGSAASASSSLA
jgi:hypothetical protein